MRSRPIAPGYLASIILVGCVSVALLAWHRKQPAPQQTKQSFSDTVPREKKIRNLDEALEELDRVDFKAEMEKAMKEVELAMKHVDMAKMKADIDKSMNQIDVEKMKMEMDKAMKEIDMTKIKAELDKTLKEVDMSKMKEEMDKAMKEVDMAKIKQQLDEVKNIDMKQLQEEMQKLQGQLKDLQPKIQEELEKAKLDVEKAKEEIKEYKSFVDALDKDGLINKNKEYSIEHKDGELIINGKKQPADVYNKYRSFLEKHKKFSMKKSADDFDLNNDN